MTDSRRRVMFAVEFLLACGAVVLAAITAIWRDWIEIVFGIDPDNHSGTLEWVIVGFCLTVAVVSGAAARAQWRRLHPKET